MNIILKTLALCAAAPIALSAIAPTPLYAQSGDAPDPVSLKNYVEKLVSFGTRHTLSSPDHPTRGIGAARKWATDEFKKISSECGNCLTHEDLSRTFTGPRAPNGVNVVNVLAIQKGSAGFDHVIIIGSHLDSRARDVMDFTIDAPGANDDASGNALVIETARILSKQKFKATIVYALITGEEQGLWGSTLLAETARARGWHVSAMLNNDVVGNTLANNGTIVDDRVRIFSEGIRFSENHAENLARRGSGGEDDGPSRSLMRAIKAVGAKNPDLNLEVFGVRRPDRFRRGGDHLPFLQLGYPAVRFTVGAEHYRFQHEDVRVENGVAYGDTIDQMDFDYLSRVTALNIATIKQLGNAPTAPQSASLAGAVSSDTTVSWTPVKGVDQYRVYYRRNDKRDWTGSRLVTGSSAKFENMIVDDMFFGVASVSPEGHESIITFAGLPQSSR